MSEHHGEKPFSLSFTEAGKSNVPILSGNNEYRGQLTMEQGLCCYLLMVGGTTIGMYVPTLQRMHVWRGASFLLETQTLLHVLAIFKFWKQRQSGLYVFIVLIFDEILPHWETIDFKENRALSCLWNNFSPVLNITVLTSVPSLNSVIKRIQTQILFCTEICLQACPYKSKLFFSNTV